MVVATRDGVHLAEQPPEQQTPRWTIIFPDGLDVRVNDQVVTLGLIYLVTELGNPNSYSVQTPVHAIIIGQSGTGGGGTGATQLVTNATINSYAPGNVPKLVGVRGEVTTPSAKDMATYGGTVRHVLLLSPAYNGVATDILPGDHVQIVARDEFPTVVATRYLVVEAPQVGDASLPLYRAVIAEKTQR